VPLDYLKASSQIHFAYPKDLFHDKNVIKASRIVPNPVAYQIVAHAYHSQLLVRLFQF